MQHRIRLGDAELKYINKVMYEVIDACDMMICAAKSNIKEALKTRDSKKEKEARAMRARYVQERCIARDFIRKFDGLISNKHSRRKIGKLEKVFCELLTSDKPTQVQ